MATDYFEQDQLGRFDEILANMCTAEPSLNEHAYAQDLFDNDPLVYAELETVIGGQIGIDQQHGNGIIEIPPDTNPVEDWSTAEYTADGNTFYAQQDQQGYDQQMDIGKKRRRSTTVQHSTCMVTRSKLVTGHRIIGPAVDHDIEVIPIETAPHPKRTKYGHQITGPTVDREIEVIPIETMPATPKRAKLDSEKDDPDDKYKKAREKNNLAVRVSREKHKAIHTQMKEENAQLKERVAYLERNLKIQMEARETADRHKGFVEITLKQATETWNAERASLVNMIHSLQSKTRVSKTSDQPNFGTEVSGDFVGLDFDPDEFFQNLDAKAV